MENHDIHRLELEALADIARVLAGSGSYVNRATRVMEVLLKISKADRCTLRQLDRNGKQLTAMAWAGKFAKGSPIKSVVVKNSLVGEAYEKGEALLVNDFQKWPRASSYAQKEDTSSAIALPVKHERGLLGVIGLASSKKGHFTEERVQLLSAVVQAIGLFMENARLMDSLQKQAEELMEANSALRQRTKEITVLNDMFQETLDERFTLADAFNDLHTRLQGIFSIAEMAVTDGDAAALAARLSAIRQLLQAAVSSSNPENMPQLKRSLTQREA